MWFKKWISDIKFHQNHENLSFLMIFNDLYITLTCTSIEIPTENDPKRSKMIQNDQKWSTLIKLYDNVIQKMDFWYQISWFSMIIIDFYRFSYCFDRNSDSKTVQNGLKWSKMIRNYPHWSLIRSWSNYVNW